MAGDYRRRTDSLPTCMNCGALLYGEFCSNCGQKNSQPITFAGTWHDFRGRLVRLDYRWARTLAALTADPGRLVRRFLRGERLPYSSPVAYVLAGLGSLALVAWLGVDLSAAGTPWAGAGGGSRPIFLLSLLAVPAVLLPVAWLQRLLHRERRFNLAETYVFGLFVFGHLAIYQAVFALLGGFASTLGLIALAAMTLLVLSFALGGFYGQKLLSSLPAASILGMVYVAGVFVLGALIRRWI